jgi:asparagine synthetase B (glutamine-hydrolysing)
MCGIVGFLTSRAADIPETQTLRTMRDTLHHRGPDDLGEFIRPLDGRGPFLFFGHRRLSIIDLWRTSAHVQRRQDGLGDL